MPRELCGCCPHGWPYASVFVQAAYTATGLSPWPRAPMAASRGGAGFSPAGWAVEVSSNFVHSNVPNVRALHPEPAATCPSTYRGSGEPGHSGSTNQDKVGRRSRPVDDSTVHCPRTTVGYARVGTFGLAGNHPNGTCTIGTSRTSCRPGDSGFGYVGRPFVRHPMAVRSSNVTGRHFVVRQFPDPGLRASHSTMRTGRHTFVRPYRRSGSGIGLPCGLRRLT